MPPTAALAHITALALIVRTAAADLLPTLHEHALSHHAFHADAVKLALARLAAPTSADAPPPAAGRPHAAIVGVEWGRDVQALVAGDFRVTAVEADAAHAASLRQRAQAEGWAAHVAVVEAYAGQGKDGTFRLDDMLGDAGELAVLSVDVQGAEHQVLQGAANALSQGRIRTLWVESIACQADALHALHLLHAHGYVLYDFAPWGQPLAEAAEAVPASRAAFLYEPTRPPTVDAYWQWLCDAQRASYRWLQTDILAVRPEAHSAAFRRGLAELPRLCGEPYVACTLRHLLDLPAAAAPDDDAAEAPPPTLDTSSESDDEPELDQPKDEL